MSWQVVMGYVGYAVGVAGVGLACWFYEHLRRWARQCQYARIVVSYKRKVKLNAPIQEWVLWTNMLDKDKDSNGRVVYTMGGTSVAIIKKSFLPETPWKKVTNKFKKIRSKKPSENNGKRSVQSVEGAWSAEDETVRQ